MSELEQAALELLEGIGRDVQLEYFREWLNQSGESRDLRARANAIDDVIGAVRSRINRKAEGQNDEQA